MRGTEDDLHQAAFKASQRSRFTLRQRAGYDGRRSLAQGAEQWVAKRLNALGLVVQKTNEIEHYDLIAGSLRIEVKAARWSAGRRGYQFNMRSNEADYLILVCIDGCYLMGVFVIPFCQVNASMLEINQNDPALYRGKWSSWFEAWSQIC